MREPGRAHDRRRSVPFVPPIGGPGFRKLHPGYAHKDRTLAVHAFGHWLRELRL